MLPPFTLVVRTIEVAAYDIVRRLVSIQGPLGYGIALPTLLLLAAANPKVPGL